MTEQNRGMKSVHPAEILKIELAARYIGSGFCEDDRTFLSRLIDMAQGFDDEACQRLEELLEIDAEVWRNLRDNYEGKLKTKSVVTRPGATVTASFDEDGEVWITGVEDAVTKEGE